MPPVPFQVMDRVPVSAAMPAPDSLSTTEAVEVLEEDSTEVARIGRPIEAPEEHTQNIQTEGVSLTTADEADDLPGEACDLQHEA